MSEIDLPAGIVVLLVADGTDHAQYRDHGVGADYIDERQYFRLIDKSHRKDAHVEEHEPYQQEPFAADHVLGVRYVVEKVSRAVIDERYADADSEHLERDVGHEYKGDRAFDRKK